MTGSNDKTSPALSELTPGELRLYGRKLGIVFDDRAAAGEMLRRIRERQELLVELDREALLDICIWAHRPVRQSASKEELASEIATITRMRFDGLSHKGLVALARLRGILAGSADCDAELIQRLKAAESIWDKLRRKRRAVVGSVIGKLLEGQSGSSEAAEGEYHFLPEENGQGRWRERIEEAGVVGGIARRIKGVADDYVREKLDEIEARIDRKLDEIDARLAEWRDREIANRLRIIKITLVASVLVAALSLGYSAIRSRVTEPTVPASAPAPPDGERGGGMPAASR